MFTSLLDATFGGDSRSTTLNVPGFLPAVEPILQVDDAKVVDLPIDVYDLLFHCIVHDTSLGGETRYRSFSTHWNPELVVLNPTAQRLGSTTHLGHRYCDVRSSAEDSNVFFRTSSAGTGSIITALGQIQAIYLHKRKLANGDFRHQVFAVLQLYEELSVEDDRHDPYRIYDGLQARMVYSTLSRALVVRPMRDILSHIAVYPYPDHIPHLRRRTSVTISLYQVRPVITLHYLDSNVQRWDS